MRLPAIRLPRPFLSVSVSPRHRALRAGVALVLCAAAVGQWQRVAARARAAGEPRGLVRELARELGPVRAIAARLSVAESHHPCIPQPAVEPDMPDMACTPAPAWLRPPGVLRILRLASAANRERTDPEAMHALALIDLLAEPGDGKSLDRSIHTLWTVTRISDRPAAAWADLSAAYLIRAEHGGVPRDLLAAVEAAERALEHAPRSRSALYNRALALQRFGLADVAAAAWREYLAMDARSPWAGEARRRLGVVSGGPVRPAPPPATDAALAVYAAYARADPQAARLLGQDRLLGEWGAAVLAGDPAMAERHLSHAEALGEALRWRPGGDQTLWEMVRHVRSLGESAAVRVLATAHRDYAVGRALYDSARYVAAEPRMRMAATAGSPALRGWAELFLANIRFYAGNPQGADADLGRLVARTDTVRHTSLAARVRWSIAGFRVRSDRYESALVPGEASARLFARAGEREYLAGNLSTLGNAQFALGDADAAYASWHRALAAVRPYRSSMRLHTLMTCDCLGGGE